jgi:signal transduction histidine kinase
MGKGAKLYVQNTYKAGATVDYTRFFERFYREDESHNSKKSGFGIGLSIAEEMCAKMNANIQVSYDRKREEIVFTVTYKQ